MMLLSATRGRRLAEGVPCTPRTARNVVARGITTLVRVLRGRCCVLSGGAPACSAQFGATCACSCDGNRSRQFCIINQKQQAGTAISHFEPKPIGVQLEALEFEMGQCGRAPRSPEHGAPARDQKHAQVEWQNFLAALQWIAVSCDHKRRDRVDAVGYTGQRWPGWTRD